LTWGIDGDFEFLFDMEKLMFESAENQEKKMEVDWGNTPLDFPWGYPYRTEISVPRFLFSKAVAVNLGL
jgi:hypothetical protein